MNVTPPKIDAFAKHPPMQSWKKLVLFLPLLISMGWVLFSRFGMRTSGKVEQLSPGGVEPFFIALMLFILGYVVFLLLLFSEDISEMLHKDN